MSRKPTPMTRLEELSDEEDRRITAAAESDPDNPPATDEELAEMRPIRVFLGRPPKPDAKQLVSIRYQPEVLAYFRSTGLGWQARMDAVLAEHVRKMKSGREG
jgi:uncharacterized protein (DUF4415 family)